MEAEKSLIIRDWLDGMISSEELSFHLKHYNKLVPLENPN